MLPGDYDCARYALAVYDGPEGFDHYDAGDDLDGVCWGLAHLDGFDVLSFCGTRRSALRDWLSDALAVAIETPLGFVHPGFWLGVSDAIAEIKPLLTQPYVVTGHSLGAAHADVFTALAADEGFAPRRRVVFGEPLVGFQPFASRVAAIDGASYCNADANALLVHRDPVTMIPFPIGGEGYVRPTPLVMNAVTPSADDVKALGVFALHSMSLYARALEPK